MKLNEVFTFRALRNYTVAVALALSLGISIYLSISNVYQRWEADNFTEVIPSEFGQLSWRSTQRSFGMCILIAWDLNKDLKWQDEMETTAIVPRAKGSEIQYSPWRTIAAASDDTSNIMHWGVSCVKDPEIKMQTDLLADFGTGRGLYTRNGDRFLYISSDRKHLYYLGIDI